LWILVPEHQEAKLGRRGYPPEFRRKVLDLLEEGRSVAQVAHDLDISEQSIYTWRRQDRINKGLVPGLTSKEISELTAANKRIAELETELKAPRRAVELLREEASQEPVLGVYGSGGSIPSSPWGTTSRSGTARSSC
jgi:transposase